MKETCYMCAEPSVSKEHVPPKCVFPEQKDANGNDYRKELITVPSCEQHNLAKSTDDEYLMMVLTSYFKGNEAAQMQISSKIARSWARNPSLSNSVVKNLTSVTVDGREQYAFEVDTDRFDRSLAWAANGLFFHIYGKPIDPPYKVISYPLFQTNGADGNAVNSGRANILNMANEFFEKFPREGKNPEVFWFQVSRVLDGRSFLRMCFFESFTVITMSSTWPEE